MAKFILSVFSTHTEIFNFITIESIVNEMQTSLT